MYNLWECLLEVQNDFSKYNLHVGNKGRPAMDVVSVYMYAIEDDNRACHPGGQYWNYYPGDLSLSEVITIHFKIKHS